MAPCHAKPEGIVGAFVDRRPWFSCSAAAVATPAAVVAAAIVIVIAGVAVVICFDRHSCCGYREQDGFIAFAHRMCHCSSAPKRSIFRTKGEKHKKRFYAEFDRLFGDSGKRRRVVE